MFTQLLKANKHGITLISMSPICGSIISSELLRSDVGVTNNPTADYSFKKLIHPSLLCFISNYLVITNFLVSLELTLSKSKMLQVKNISVYMHSVCTLELHIADL